ncbi:MAG: HNH endonuclease [Lachnospiraceae bacterium]|nr:HNH endonuclease [Lachnospiraceae bacterium]
MSEGGTNDEENLESLCRSCHEKIHHGRVNR